MKKYSMLLASCFLGGCISSAGFADNHNHVSKLPNPGIYTFKKYISPVNCDYFTGECRPKTGDSILTEVILNIKNDSTYIRDVYFDKNKISTDSAKLVLQGSKVTALGYRINSIKLKSYIDGTLTITDQVINSVVYGNYSLSVDMVSVSDSCFSYHETLMPEHHEYATVEEACLSK